MNPYDYLQKQEIVVARFETQRLVLRPFESKDAAGLLEILCHPRATCFVDDRLDTIEEAAADVERRGANMLEFAVCLKEQDAIIGVMFAAREDPDCYSVGWQLNARYEGKGYAKEAATAFFDALFTHMGARRVYAYVDEGNRRSQKLCERLCMRREGLFMEYISFVKNEDGTPRYENTCIYAVLKKEWQAASLTA